MFARDFFGFVSTTKSSLYNQRVPKYIFQKSKISPPFHFPQISKPPLTITQRCIHTYNQLYVSNTTPQTPHTPKLTIHHNTKHHTPNISTKHKHKTQKHKHKKHKNTNTHTNHHTPNMMGPLTKQQSPTFESSIQESKQQLDNLLQLVT